MMYIELYWENNEIYAIYAQEGDPLKLRTSILNIRILYLAWQILIRFEIFLFIFYSFS